MKGKAYFLLMIIYLLTLSFSLIVESRFARKHHPASGHLILKDILNVEDEDESDSEEAVRNPRKRQSGGMQEPNIMFFHVNSVVRSRFAMTTVSCRIGNVDNRAQEIPFTIKLPDKAFISNFTMEIENELIVGDVKEKKEAKMVYDAAVEEGLSAGHLALRQRETNEFKTSINVGPLEKVTFNLTYQEVLTRVHGVYKHAININPGQVVKNLEVKVEIMENREITTLHVPKISETTAEKSNKDLLAGAEDKDVHTSRINLESKSKVHVVYIPDTKMQKQSSVDGLNVQLVTLYDVERSADGGDIQVVDGYFVHFFAPPGIEPGRKQIMFVLDTSGSMTGTKIHQTKDAMETILRDLNEGDYFNIISFSDIPRLWTPESLLITPRSLRSAAEHIQSLQAMGGTNIDEALKMAMNKLVESETETLSKMIVFLTDGQATTGEVNNEQIIKNVQNSNDETVYLHSIGFGQGADFGLLRKLSSKNRGLARRVYEDSDAALQLEGFHAEISNLLLTQVNIVYMNDTVESGSVVQSTEYNYYQGSEFMIAGKLNVNRSSSSDDDKKDLEAEVKGLSRDGEKRFRCLTPMFDPVEEPVERLRRDPNSAGGIIERMWAYLTIRKRLDESTVTEDSKKAEELRKQALSLSLKYKFVTELTSMVIVRNDHETRSLSSKMEDDQAQPGLNWAHASPNNGHGHQNPRCRLCQSIPVGQLMSSWPVHTPDSAKRYRQMRPPPRVPDIQSTTTPLLICAYPNEEIHQCGRDCEEKCNTTLSPCTPTPCAPTNPNEYCGCTAGHVRHLGLCIPRSKCPRSCSVNQTSNFVQDRCRLNCQSGCGKPRTLDLACEHYLCDSDECVCKEDYVKDITSGQCILPVDCPNVPHECDDPNAEVKDCHIGCGQAENCSSYDGQQFPKCSVDNGICPPPKCVCKPGFVIDDQVNGTCVRPRECSRFQCGDDEELVSCGGCEKECSNVWDNQDCARICGSPQCQCKPGLVRHDQQCIPVSNCPNICPTNEHYSACYSRDQEPQCSEDSSKRDPVKSSKSYAVQTTCGGPGCACDADFYRSLNGSCVTHCQDEKDELLEVMQVGETDAITDDMVGEACTSRTEIRGSCDDLPIEQGEECRGCESRIAWHYDRYLDTCIAFTHRGCGGYGGNAHRTYRACIYGCSYADKMCSGSMELQAYAESESIEMDLERNASLQHLEKEEEMNYDVQKDPKGRCPTGFEWQIGPFGEDSGACCNTTVENWFKAKYANRCSSGSLSHKIYLGPYNYVTTRLISTDCDLIQCPTGYRCERQNQLFVSCCRIEQDESMFECDDPNEEWSECPPVSEECEPSCGNLSPGSFGNRCSNYCGQTPRCVCSKSEYVRVEPGGPCVRSSECDKIIDDTVPDTSSLDEINEGDEVDNGTNAQQMIGDEMPAEDNLEDGELPSEPIENFSSFSDDLEEEDELDDVVECGENEQFLLCGQNPDCIPTCANPEPECRFDSVADSESDCTHPASCACLPDYILDAPDGTCIPTSDCPTAEI